MIIICDEDDAEEELILYQTVLRECIPKLQEWSREYTLRKEYLPKSTYKIRKKIDRMVLKTIYNNAPNRTPHDLEIVFERTVKSIRRIHKNLVNQNLVIGLNGTN